VLELEEEGVDNVKVRLVRTGSTKASKTGIFDAFDEEIFAELPRNYVISMWWHKQKPWMGHALWLGHMFAK
jgi:hypothetical protein